MLAVVMTLTSTRTAVVADLSSTGIRLSGANLPAKGQLLEIKIDTVAAFGSVVWSTNSQCGVAFEPPLASSNVEALRIRAGKTRLSNMSVQERQALEEWLLGVSP